MAAMKTPNFSKLGKGKICSVGMPSHYATHLGDYLKSQGVDSGWSVDMIVSSPQTVHAGISRTSSNQELITTATYTITHPQYHLIYKVQTEFRQDGNCPDDLSIVAEEIRQNMTHNINTILSDLDLDQQYWQPRLI